MGFIYIGEMGLRERKELRIILKVFVSIGWNRKLKLLFIIMGKIVIKVGSLVFTLNMIC